MAIRQIVRRPGPLAVHLGILLLCGIWGSTWLVIREGLADLPPFASLAVRFAAAAGVMSVVAPSLARLEGGERPGMLATGVHALLILAVPYAIIYWVEVRLPSGLVSVLWSVYPMVTAVVAHVWPPQEHLVGRQWLGLIGGFLGVALMFSTDLRSLGHGTAGLVLLAAPVVSAVGNNWIKRIGAGKSSALLNARGMLFAALAVSGLALAVERHESMRWSATAIGSVAYLALAGTVVTFGVYFWLLRHAPVTRLSIIAYGVPVVALLLGGTVGEEPVGLATVGGMLLILVGVALMISGPRRRSLESSPERFPSYAREANPCGDDAESS